MRSAKPVTRLPAAIIVLAAATASYSIPAEDSAVEIVLAATAAACDGPDAATMAARLPGSAMREAESLRAGDTEVGWVRSLVLPEGDELKIERIAPGGRLRRLLVEHWVREPGDTVRANLAAIAGGDCDVVLGRRILYEGEGNSARAVAIRHLDAALDDTDVTEPLDPPIPQGADPGGVSVAMVDSGVNYLLPAIGDRLARDDNGAPLGYDYWDMDPRPFDANPARSPFFPQRHGTRTASLLLAEAPAVRLVPYRYPRPAMQRMGDLVRDAAGKGIVIVNLSLGSNRAEEWEAFAAAATANPQMLFVVSAGNEGRDIDDEPVYPASLELDNILVVTSSEHTGEIARGSNQGRRTVDLLVPAEEVSVTDFDGTEIPAAGSSYAAARVSALAARLLAAHPEWRAGQLKEAIIARALPPFPELDMPVAAGFVPRPERAELRPALELDGEPRVTSVETLELPRESGARPAPSTHRLDLAIARFQSGGWPVPAVRRHARQMAHILIQCGIVVDAVDLYTLDAADSYQYFRDRAAAELVRRTGLPRPAMYLVRDTLQEIAFEAEAIGRANSASRPELRDTVWIIEGARDPGIIFAHELVHLLVDNGEHSDLPGNLMREETSPGNTTLTAAQCRDIVAGGTARGLLSAANP